LKARRTHDIASVTRSESGRHSRVNTPSCHRQSSPDLGWNLRGSDESRSDHNAGAVRLGLASSHGLQGKQTGACMGVFAHARPMHGMVPACVCAPAAADAACGTVHGLMPGTRRHRQPPRHSREPACTAADARGAESPTHARTHDPHAGPKTACLYSTTSTAQVTPASAADSPRQPTGR
jgi:hypothetical protein